MLKAAICVEMIRSTLQRSLSTRESKSLCRTSYSSLLGGGDTGKSEQKGTLAPEGGAHCATLELTVGLPEPALKFAGGSSAPVRCPHCSHLWQTWLRVVESHTYLVIC